MAKLLDLRGHLGTLSAILWNHGASFAVPTLDSYDGETVGFSFEVDLPGPASPRPAVIKLAEIWAPQGRLDDFRRREYAYDFIEHPLARRRAFHGHDPDHFAREFGVLVHEHCEERLGLPDCDQYYGLPITAHEAIRQFVSLWGQPGPIGCAALRCIA